MALTGVATDKNMLGMVCLVFGLGAVWRLTLELKRKKTRSEYGAFFAQGAILAIALWLLWKANSMTSISCFVFGTFIMLFISFSRFGRKRFLIHAMVIGMLTISVSALFLNLGTGLVQSVGRNPTLTGRTDLWQHLLAMDRNPLLGTGFGSFWLGPRIEKLWSIYWWKPNESHDGYLETYLNLGWVGVGLLGILIVSGYRHVMKLMRYEPDVGKLCLAYFVAGLAYNFTEAAFKTMNLMWIVFLLAIMTMPRVPLRKATTPIKPAGPGVPQPKTLQESAV
jgi:exopolysaccharide production protein ExoQ